MQGEHLFSFALLLRRKFSSFILSCFFSSFGIVIAGYYLDYVYMLKKQEILIVTRFWKNSAYSAGKMQHSL